jgi:hypothetical protein
MAGQATCGVSHAVTAVQLRCHRLAGGLRATGHVKLLHGRPQAAGLVHRAQEVNVALMRLIYVSDYERALVTPNLSVNYRLWRTRSEAKS